MSVYKKWICILWIMLDRIGFSSQLCGWNSAAEKGCISSRWMRKYVDLGIKYIYNGRRSWTASLCLLTAPMVWIQNHGAHWVEYTKSSSVFYWKSWIMKKRKNTRWHMTCDVLFWFCGKVLTALREQCRLGSAGSAPGRRERFCEMRRKEKIIDKNQEVPQLC